MLNSNIAMEVIIAAANNSDNFDLGFAIQVALLHDTMEDTATDFGELANTFGIEIANAVSALIKDKSLPKEISMQDSLSRIKNYSRRYGP